MTAPVVDAPASGAPPDEPDSGAIGTAVRDYIGRVRGGDVGSLPAVLGLLVLVLVFSLLKPGTFTNALNFANLLHQSSAVIVIAMGLVFVLLLGEIDLSAGYAAGTAAAVMGIFATKWGWPWWVAILGCLATGAVIGIFIGVLVARLGIPSFVVTLATFLGLQGVLLNLIGEGGTISIREIDELLAINNDDLPVVVGWVLAILTVAAYAYVTLRRAAIRRAGGLPAPPGAVLIGKIALVAVPVLAATAYLSIDRSPNERAIIRGVPLVVLLVIVLLVGLTFVLARTAFGQHVYAVGGNTEAARRAGINVRQVKLACFMIGTTMAAIGGILLASRNNSISPTTGGADTLLYAVGAAVIGGTSLFGGKGRVIDAVLGGLVIGVIINGMGLLGQKSSVVYMVTGAVLLLAASVDAISRRRAASTGRL